MSIIAIEGPDKCGKSTLFAALQRVRWGRQRPAFVDPVSFGRERMHVASDLALRELEMWEALYQRDTVYISNRHVLVTDAVYSAVYSRKMLRSSWLQEHVFVLYLDVSTAVLQYRHVACGEVIQDIAKYDEVKEWYWRVLPRFQHAVLPQNFAFNDVLALLRGKYCALSD